MVGLVRLVLFVILAIPVSLVSWVSLLVRSHLKNMSKWTTSASASLFLTGVNESAYVCTNRQTLAGRNHRLLRALPHQGGEAQAPFRHHPPHLHLDGEKVVVPE